MYILKYIKHKLRGAIVMSFNSDVVSSIACDKLIIIFHIEQLRICSFILLIIIILKQCIERFPSGKLFTV